MPSFNEQDSSLIRCCNPHGGCPRGSGWRFALAVEVQRDPDVPADPFQRGVGSEIRLLAAIACRAARVQGWFRPVQGRGGPAALIRRQFVLAASWRRGSMRRSVLSRMK